MVFTDTNLKLYYAEVNKILKSITILSGLAFLFFLLLSVRMLIQTPFVTKEGFSKVEEREFHYALFLPVTNQSFFQRLREGALDAAAAKNCAVTFHSIYEDPDSLSMVQYSGFNGIGLYLYENDKKTMDLLKTIQDKGIPIVQIESEIIQGPATFLIGTNNFNVGKGIGKLALQTGFDSLNMVLVYSRKNPGVYSDATLIEMGIKNVLKEKLSMLRREATSLNPLDAERIVYDILKNDPSVDVLVLTDPNDTLVAVQAIIDLNLVGKVQIIGFGDQELIKTYIDKGLILGSIVRNPYRIGYSAVMALYELSTNSYTSSFVDTGITLLRRDRQ